jgi:diacylglycerol kinase family enzyme
MRIPRDRDEALKVILGEYEKTIDLMRVNERYAAVTVGIGLDAEIAYRAYKSKRLRLLAYWYHGLGMLFKPLPRFRLSIDAGEEHLEDEYLLVVTGNAGCYGRYMKMMPGASMDDGEIDLATFFPMNKLKALFFFALLTIGKHTWSRDFGRYSARDITIECLNDVYAQFDGEVVVFPEGERLEMKVEPLAMTVRVSRKHASA